MSTTYTVKEVRRDDRPLAYAVTGPKPANKEWPLMVEKASADAVCEMLNDCWQEAARAFAEEFVNR